MATQTLFTLPQQQRGPFTDFKTPSFTIPAGITQATIQTNISSADLADPTKSIEVHMECSTDGFVNDIRFQAGFTWQGGGVDKNGNPFTVSPGCTFDGLAQMSGEQCRLSITIPIAITVGATVSVS